jgi:glutathionylspermidine synthase
VTRIEVTPRKDWQARLEELGFSFHSVGGCYWNEGACYEFTSEEVDHIEEVTGRLHEMCLKAVDHVIDRDLFSRIGIGPRDADLVRESWRRDDPTVYGRFDLSYDGTRDPKLLEYNADTPTALYETSVAQWVWLEEVFPGYDQFNSLHEKLAESFETVKRKMPVFSTLHFSCVRDHDEDLVTIEYLRDVATQAGIRTKHLFIEDIGYNDGAETFCDLEDEPIDYLFKLYPWEWILNDEFGRFVSTTGIRILEPPWKMVLSNKGILPVLWEMYQGHPNLLPSFFDRPAGMGDYVKKPLLSREGANVEFFKGDLHLSAEGTYGLEGYVYQELRELPRFGDSYAVTGSWIAGGRPAGIGMREDRSPVTRNTSRFVPHYFKP